MTTAEISTEPNSDVDTAERDRRQSCLIADPNYGIVLSFFERFRSALDLPTYSLQRLEDHLVQHQERGE